MVCIVREEERVEDGRRGNDAVGIYIDETERKKRSDLENIDWQN